jgi:hypothetical protein
MCCKDENCMEDPFCSTAYLITHSQLMTGQILAAISLLLHILETKNTKNHAQGGWQLLWVPLSLLCCGRGVSLGSKIVWERGTLQIMYDKK